MKLLAQFPDVVEDAARELEPHRIVFHLIELAGGVPPLLQPPPHHRRRPGARRAPVSTWPRAVQRVLRIGLDLLGVSAPEAM